MGTSSEHTAPVGRAEQIRALDVLLGVVAREADEDAPRIRSLLIGGDAGIGKTTLVEVLAERCRAMGLSCAVGHCLDLATGMPFGPVVEALRDLHDRQTTEDSPVPRLSWLASEASSRSPSLESLVEATEILGRAGPAVLVIEDLHWADSSVRDFALAAQRTGRAPLLLVLTFRADDVTAGHPLRGPLVELSRSPRAVRMDLSGLAAHDVRELVRRRSGHAPDTERLAALMLHSDGNPLYVEELLSADEPGVPGLLHDLLLRHVGALSSSAVRISRLASVDGSRIDLEVLEEAAGLAPPAFAQAIHEMLERHVVVRHGNRYDFRHALLRESVHDDLLPGEIVEMHAAYARALRGRVESGSTEQRWRYGASLALHAMGAGDWPLALEASVWAGVAGKQYGSAAAADHFEPALYLWDRVPDAAERTGLSKADLPRLAARVLANEGVRDRVHDLLRLAVDLLDPDGDPLAACRVHTAVGANWSEVPGLPSRRESLDRAIALAGTTPTRELADALIASTFHGCRVGRYTEALDFATRALDVARAIGADDLVTEALWELAEPLWLLGRCSEALEVYREAVREAERSDELGAALEASGELAFYLSLYGSVDEAVQISRQVRERAERAGLPRYVAFAAGSNAPGVNHSPRLIEICEGLSDPERALDAAEALMQEVAPRDSPLEHALAADYAYRTLVLAGPSAARPAQPLAAAAAVSLDFARQRLTPEWGRTWDGMHLAIAEAFEAQLSGQSAIPQWHAAVDLAVAFGRYTSLRPRLELARAQLAHGERDEGKAMLFAVWHEAHEMGSRWLESQAAVAARRFRVPLPLDVDEPGPLDRLTPREREVLDHVARGATNRAIASALFITEKTASVHVGNVIAKLGVSNRGEAAALARSVRSDRDP